MSDPFLQGLFVLLRCVTTTDCHCLLVQLMLVTYCMYVYKYLCNYWVCNVMWKKKYNVLFGNV